MIDWVDTLLLMQVIFALVAASLLVFVDEDNHPDNLGEFFIAGFIIIFPIANIIYIGYILHSILKSELLTIPKPLNELIKLVLKNGDYHIDNYSTSLYNKSLNLRIGVDRIQLDGTDHKTPSSISRKVKTIVDNIKYSDKLEIYKRSKQNV